MNRFRLLLLGALLGLATPPVFADSFLFSYSGSGIVASGTLTGALTQSPGVYEISAITGTRNGAIITELDTKADYADQLLYYPATNTGTALNPSPLDISGIAYLVGQNSYNIYSSGAQPALVENDESSPLTAFSVTQVAVTPEPGSLVLLGSGILSMMGVIRRRASLQE